ncbi:MAG: sialidase family protein [Caldilineaceae bacterium]
MAFLRSLFSFLVAFALLLGSFGPLWAQSAAPGNSGTPSTVVAGHEKINLMAPIQDLISGPGWLMARGVDARPTEGAPEWNPLTRQPLEALANPLAGLNSPTAQGGAPGVLVPYRDPAPSFSRTMLVTRDFSDRALQTEPDIAVDPLDPDHLVLGTIDYNFPANSVYVSIDGGANWDGPIQTKYVRDDLGAGGDPVVKFDSQGNVYIASISIGVDEYNIGAASGSALISSIAIAASTDGGYTWSEPVATAKSTVETNNVEVDPTGRLRGTIALSFLDKPWMFIGPHPTIEDQEVIYVTYVEFKTLYDILYIGEVPVLGAPTVETTPKLVSSTDNGVTWSEPVAVGPTVRRIYGEGGSSEGEGFNSEGAAESEQAALNGEKEGKIEVGPEAPRILQGVIADNLLQGEAGEGEGEKRTVQGVVPVVDSKGVVYVFWFDSTDDESQKGLGEFYMAKSEDAGATFERPKRIASFLEPGFRPRTAFFRYWASVFPKAAVGPNDELYIVFTALPPERPADEGDIYFIRSTDGGSRWSRPKRINQDETTAVQFFPAIAVSPNGRINVMWGDMRDDSVETRFHIYYTSSEDQGDTWGFKNDELGLDVADTRVTDFPTNPNKAFPQGLFIGDYFSIAATDDEAYMVWADGRLAEYGGVNQKIGFARKRQMSNPEIFLSPDAGSGGETITVQGHGFQPDLNYFLLVEGETVASGRTNSDGRMTASVFIPISGEGPHPVTLVDGSGNVASTSFYMEFGFNNIQDNLKQLHEQIDQLSSSTVPTTTSASNQVASYTDDRIQHLESELADIKGLLRQEQSATQPPAVAAPAIAAAGLLGGAPNWMLGLVALAGLVLGIVLTQLRQNQRR